MTEPDLSFSHLFIGSENEVHAFSAPESSASERTTFLAVRMSSVP
eukprot:CAMPEP_0181529442 /NCGR_PEP_ID=MMETSP1110-20121109/71058_1 /TAXON_ID=174948 /ORGANISM="Symbiodinium sp., Strain CCMP421" /LENGTH=44 /DNA_ID= /DNA_START= /DNA_END= /DNA_ORIENTATION=